MNIAPNVEPNDILQLLGEVCYPCEVRVMLIYGTTKEPIKGSNIRSYELFMIDRVSPKFPSIEMSYSNMDLVDPAKVLYAV